MKWLFKMVALSLMSAGAHAADVPKLAESAAREYRELAKYPEWTLPVPAGASNPVLSERKPAVITQLGPNGSGPALAVWASDVRYERGDEVLVYAQLQERRPKDRDILSAPSGSAQGPWTVTGELLDQSGEALAALAFNDSGAGADERANDGVFSATYTLGEAAQPALGQAASLGFRVTAVNDAQESRVALGGFQYSHPAARLTGQFRDRVEAGNLVLSAQVVAKQAGRVHMAVVIDNALGLPLAIAQKSLELAEGEQWIDVPVYGLVLREAGAGVLRVGSVTLTTTQGMPNALGEVLEQAHTTAAYLPGVFTDKPFGRASLLDAAARLEALAD